MVAKAIMVVLILFASCADGIGAPKRRCKGGKTRLHPKTIIINVIIVGAVTTAGYYTIKKGGF